MRWEKPKLQPLPTSVAEAAVHRVFQPRRPAAPVSFQPLARRRWGPFLALAWLRAKRRTLRLPLVSLLARN